MNRFWPPRRRRSASDRAADRCRSILPSRPATSKTGSAAARWIVSSISASRMTLAARAGSATVLITATTQPGGRASSTLWSRHGPTAERSRGGPAPSVARRATRVAGRRAAATSPARSASGRARPPRGAAIRASPARRAGGSTSPAAPARSGFGSEAALTSSALRGDGAGLVASGRRPDGRRLAVALPRARIGAASGAAAAGLTGPGSPARRRGLGRRTASALPPRPAPAAIGRVRPLRGADDWRLLLRRSAWRAGGRRRWWRASTALLRGWPRPPPRQRRPAAASARFALDERRARPSRRSGCRAA